MGKINIQKDLFHIQTETLSYISGISPENHLLHLYFGPALSSDSDGVNLFPPESMLYGNSIEYSEKSKNYFPDMLCFEFPGGGKGDYKNPAYEFISSDGNRVFDFKYNDYEIKEIMEAPLDMPGFSGNGKTLILSLVDELYSLELKLYYCIPDDSNAIGRFCSVINHSKDLIIINKMSSCSLDFEPSDYDLVSLDGHWIRERHQHRIEIPEGEWSVCSRKGNSSPDHSPFVVLCDSDANENQGMSWGTLLVYSGNHRTSVEKSSHGIIRLSQGINHENFQWKLNPEKSFSTPMAIITASDNGLNGLSHNFHQAIRNNIVRGNWKNRKRPILINNWEATYFDFNEKKLLKLADEASNLGIELFVLDDGWFGKRNDDTSSLGDWEVYTKKLPSGLKSLSEKIEKKGMLFGLWVEPEMISINSRLYEKHPEWLLKCPGRKASVGRNQYLLDLTRDDVIEYLISKLSSLFSSAKISYVKWDFNRSLSDVYSSVLTPEQQGESYHRYILGLYKVLRTLVNRFPDILFESCASGGSRFDAGITAYMPQIWTSDNTDAYERVLIQGGSSLFAPPSIMGAHVSACPNHQLIRRTSLESRFNTAAFGLLGYELDISELNHAEKKIMKKQIAFYKQYRELLQFGDFYRIRIGKSCNKHGWLTVNKDKSLAILGYFQGMAQANPEMPRIRLTGLKEKSVYEVVMRQQQYDIKSFGNLINQASPVHLKEDSFLHKTISENFSLPADKFSIRVSGKQLMNCGLRPNQQFSGIGLDDYVGFIGDFGSRIFIIREMN